MVEYKGLIVVKVRGKRVKLTKNVVKMSKNETGAEDDFVQQVEKVSDKEIENIGNKSIL